MKSLYRKTLYKIAVRISAIKAIGSNLCAIITVDLAEFQGIPITLSAASPPMSISALVAKKHLRSSYYSTTGPLSPKISLF